MTHKIFIIDTETGGFEPERNSILSLGGVVWEDGRVLGEIDFLIAEDTLDVEPEAMAINKLPLDEVRRQGLSPMTAVNTLETFLDRHFDPTQKIALAGHNIGFDVGFLKRLYMLAGADFQGRYSHRLLDTASVMRFLSMAGRLPFDNPSLDAGLLHFGIDVPLLQRHTALADARATAQLLGKLVDLMKPSNGSASG